MAVPEGPDDNWVLSGWNTKDSGRPCPRLSQHLWNNLCESWFPDVKSSTQEELEPTGSRSGEAGLAERVSRSSHGFLCAADTGSIHLFFLFILTLGCFLAQVLPALELCPQLYGPFLSTLFKFSKLWRECLSTDLPSKILLAFRVQGTSHHPLHTICAVTVTQSPPCPFYFKLWQVTAGGSFFRELFFLT